MVVMHARSVQTDLFTVYYFPGATYRRTEMTVIKMLSDSVMALMGTVLDNAYLMYSYSAVRMYQ